MFKRKTRTRPADPSLALLNALESLNAHDNALAHSEAEELLTIGGRFTEADARNLSKAIMRPSSKRMWAGVADHLDAIGRPTVSYVAKGDLARYTAAEYSDRPLTVDKETVKLRAQFEKTTREALNPEQALYRAQLLARYGTLTAEELSTEAEENFDLPVHRNKWLTRVAVRLRGLHIRTLNEVPDELFYAIAYEDFTVTQSTNQHTSNG